MKHLLLTLLFLTFFCTCARAQETVNDTVNTIFPTGQRLESERFTGLVWVERMITVDDADQPVRVGNVTFPPKSRSNWHRHPAGQSLLVLDGVGYYQQRGEPVRVLYKGETVQCPPDVEHWHGAANDNWFVQLALTKEHPRGRVLWSEPVSDTEYRKGISIEKAGNNATRTTAMRYRHIAAIATHTTSGSLDQLSSALADALDAGLTGNECKEVFVHLYAYTGFPRSIQGIKTLMAVLDKRKQAGITDKMGPEASTHTTDEPKYTRGKKILEELIGRPLTARSAYGDFSPEIDIFLKEHLFADIFERDVLSYKDREITTISALVTLGGVDPMLRGHLGIALNLGVTGSELSAVLEGLKSSLGRETVKAAEETLKEVMN